MMHHGSPRSNALAVVGLGPVREPASASQPRLLRASSSSPIPTPSWPISSLTADTAATAGHAGTVLAMDSGLASSGREPRVPVGGLSGPRVVLTWPSDQFHAEIRALGLIHPEDRLVQTIRIESSYPDRTRYLSIVALGGAAGTRDPTAGPDLEEVHRYCLVGLDRRPSPRADPPLDVTTVGLMVPLMWDMRISLDGDGGFSLRQNEEHYIFKPVSVQALWTVIQTLSLVSDHLEPHSSRKDACPNRPYVVESPQSCVNEWHWMADVLVRRPSSPRRLIRASGDSSTSLLDWDPVLDTQGVIRTRLKRIMQAADLDSITSKSIRNQLERDMKQDLEQYKSFIDKEILVILGQMDPASEILDYLYLGSEWNASNLEELQQNGITHILNVTREIDNFFPSVFKYQNIREYDEEATDLLRYLDRTYRFIKEARMASGKVLVHCKMGISRSATVTVSYLMKEYGLPLSDALFKVKQCRSIVNPNKSFCKQLEVYEGILGAIRHRHVSFDLYRSKSESSLVPSPDLSDKGEAGSGAGELGSMIDPIPLSRPTTNVDIKALTTVFSRPASEPLYLRPKSWSPSEKVTDRLIPKHGDDSDSEAKRDDCQCFGELTGHRCSSEPNHEMENTDSEGHPRPISVVEAKNVGYLMPTTPPPPVNTSLYDPSCDCDMELELGVPEHPVLIHDDDEDVTKSAQTDVIVQSLSNLPLQMRTTSQLDEFHFQGRNPASKSNLPLQRKTASSMVPKQIKIQPYENSTGLNLNVDSNPSMTVGLESTLLAQTSTTSEDTQSQSEPIGIPTPEPLIPDELSVKTLANMFDYKVGSVPLRPCSARLQDNRLFQRGKDMTSPSAFRQTGTKTPLATTEDQSEC
ncbi:uncharacterized protein LOC131886594 [Tigriopus californicus]|uniref:uncharacterized protein LOC131886594 n=1 Tax=Tigriopus californicus TaxID=6832 RepID=UPI0027DA2C38|nr:uncharacterized protein LOC131886594 [Tigriopus californicus]